MNLEAVVIGGAALNIMGVISRDTVDVDCLDPKIPEEVLKHAAELTKLFAFCDRDQDLQDCMAMKPILEELDASFEWVTERDAHPDWPENVRRHFAILKKRLGYAEK